jgi:hypothetical protein
MEILEINLKMPQLDCKRDKTILQYQGRQVEYRSITGIVRSATCKSNLLDATVGTNEKLRFDSYAPRNLMKSVPTRLPSP